MVKLEDYTIGELKKMISSFNKIVKFSGYSKLPKSKLINMIRTHPKIKVEEGSNAVKLSIKTDKDFEKQTKVKKEKVKKEVKKEVEKLDKGNIVVDVDKAKKAGIKIDVDKAKKAGIEIKKKEPSSAKIKKEIKEVLNKHYGEVAKLEQKVLDGKITESNYDDKDEELNEKLDDDLYNLKEKYNIKNMNNDTEFFENMEGSNKKYINVLKEKSFGGFKSIPNYVKANKIGDKIMENEKRVALVKKLKAEAVSRYGGKSQYKDALADIKSSNNPTYIDNKIAELEASKPNLTNKDLNKILKNIKATKTEAELNVVLNAVDDFGDTTEEQEEKILDARDRKLKVLKPEPKSTKKPNPRGVTNKSILAKRQNEIVSKAVDELNSSFEASIEDENNKGIKGYGDYKLWAQLDPEGAMVIEEDKDLSKQKKVELQKKAMDLFIKGYKKFNKENKAKKPKKARTEKQKANDKKLGETAKARAKKK
tara:strand:+ start:576 stop:2012 length:1437 start_codon:yes stop_codon:yes gene_type:complete